MFKCTKDMENITLSPTMTAKLRTKNAAKKIKQGSPKFQEVFREVSCLILFSNFQNFTNLIVLK